MVRGHSKTARSSPVARITPTVDLVPGELQACIQQMLAALGEDPQREGLQGGYQQDPATILKTFSDGGEHYDTMVFQGAANITWRRSLASPTSGICPMARSSACGSG
jgi:hypothetical protein